MRADDQSRVSPAGDAAIARTPVVFGGAASSDGDGAQHGPTHFGGSLRARSERPGRAERGLKRWHVVIAACIVAALIGMACWRWAPMVYEWLSDPAAVHAFVDEHAVMSRVAIVGINALQILLAFLPGEPIELASGYAFGFWEGTLVCLVACAIGSSIVYWSVRRWGWRVVGLFFSREQFERFRWLQNTRRLELVMLIVFLIPGTPKDFLTYFAGLTRMRFPAVLAITTLGRIPSIVTSTIAASAFGAGEYGIMVASVVAAVVLAAAGAVAYRALERRASR